MLNASTSDVLLAIVV